MQRAWAPTSSEPSPTNENQWFPLDRASLEQGGLHTSVCRSDPNAAGSGAKRQRSHARRMEINDFLQFVHGWNNLGSTKSVCRKLPNAAGSGANVRGAMTHE